MFRHRGNRRTYIHNIRLASILSLVAGMVNVCGILSIKVLTTNVTGHFAFFAEEMSHKSFSSALVFLIYILFFLLGAFVSNLMVELTARSNIQVSHMPPMILEVLLLLTVALLPERYFPHKEIIGCTLLFTMGMQNALVTKISRATVRTTHLTGLFTDLGIELSQLFFYRKVDERRQLKHSITLRITIICFFFLGGTMAGLLFKYMGIRTLMIAAAFLLLALFYDAIRLRVYIYKRKFQH